MNLARSTLETISLTSALLGRGLAADLKGDKNENGEVDLSWIKAMRHTTKKTRTEYGGWRAS